MVWYWGNLNSDAQGECMCPNSLEMGFFPQSYSMTPISIFTCILFIVNNGDDKCEAPAFSFILKSRNTQACSQTFNQKHNMND